MSKEQDVNKGSKLKKIAQKVFKNKEEHVLMFIKPYSNADGVNGNPVAFDVLKYLYKEGLSIERALAVNITPAMILIHYDELIQEGREKIVYGMVGDYVSKELSEKLLRGETLTEEELNTPGKKVFVFDMRLPSHLTIDQVRNDIVGPTKIMDINGWIKKLSNDPEYADNAIRLLQAADQKATAQYKTVRGIYQNLGPDACGSFNTVHCSDSPKSAEREIHNFFHTETFAKNAIELNVGSLNDALEESVQNDVLFERKPHTHWVDVWVMIESGYRNMILPDDFEATPYEFEADGAEA